MSKRLTRILRAGRMVLLVGFYILIRLPVFTKWLFHRVFVLMVFLLVSLFYVFSLPVTILGKLLLESESREWSPEFNIRNRVESFRGDMMDIMARQHSANSGRTRKELRTEIEFHYIKAKKKHEIGEIAVSFWGGMVAILIGFFNLWLAFSQVISMYILVILVSILVRIVVLDLLAFDRSDAKAKLRKDELELMLGWNRAILNSMRLQLAILFLGLLGWVHGPSYEIARSGLEKYLLRDLNKNELMGEIVKEAL